MLLAGKSYTQERQMKPDNPTAYRLLISVRARLFACLLGFSFVAGGLAQEGRGGSDVNDRVIRNVGILLFDGVDVLDFVGPYEVFSLTRLEPGVDSRFSGETAPFKVFTVAETTQAIRADGGLSVNPEYSFATAPGIDLLVVPGGPGARQLIKQENATTFDWIRKLGAGDTQLASVCTGALVLAKMGLFSGRKATTHWASLDLLLSLDGSVEVVKGKRFVDDEIISSAGISSGLDMSLYIVEKLLGKAVAEDTARIMDYRWESR